MVAGGKGWGTLCGDAILLFIPSFLWLFFFLSEFVWKALRKFFILQFCWIWILFLLLLLFSHLMRFPITKQCVSQYHEAKYAPPHSCTKGLSMCRGNHRTSMLLLLPRHWPTTFGVPFKKCWNFNTWHKSRCCWPPTPDQRHTFFICNTFSSTFYW